MKKTLVSCAALLCSFAALAQTPASSPRATKAHSHAATAKHADDDDERDGTKGTKPDNHGQTVSTFAKTTTLTGADKGAAISALAGGRSSARPERRARAPRGNSSHLGGRPAGSGRQAGSHSQGASHRH